MKEERNEKTIITDRRTDTVTHIGDLANEY